MQPISVLLVDDNPTFSRIAVRFLQQEDDVEVVGTAVDAEEALAQARDLRPQVILLDVVMPGRSGLEIIPSLRELLSEVRIITLTILDAPAYREAALRAGADDFVGKANLGLELIPAIRKAARREAPGTHRLSEGMPVGPWGME